MESKINNEEILSTEIPEADSFDALEKQLDIALGALQEKVPTLEVQPDVPSFQLGATPLYSHTASDTTANVSSTHSQEQIHTPSSSDFHTITGGAETLKEIAEKTAPVIHRENAQIVAGMYTKKAPAVFVEEKIFLSPKLFFWFSAVTFIFFMLGAGLPFIMEILVKNNYLLLEGNVYRDGTISFPTALVDNMLLLTFQLTITSMLILLITGTIDYGMKKNFGGFVRALIHGVIILIFWYIIYIFCKDQGVTQEQVNEVYSIIKNSLSGVLKYVELDTPAL
jgi:hypothetical protein